MNGTEIVGANVMSKVLGVTVQHFNRMVADDIIHPTDDSGRYRKYQLNLAVQDYIAYLKTHQRQASDTSVEQLEKQKLAADVDLKRAKADQESMKLAELEGTMHRSDDVRAVTEDLVYAIRSQLIALPGRVAVDTAAATTAKETSAIVRQEVFHVLEDLANYSYSEDKYMELVRQREKWITENDDAGGQVEES